MLVALFARDDDELPAALRDQPQGPSRRDRRHRGGFGQWPVGADRGAVRPAAACRRAHHDRRQPLRSPAQADGSLQGLRLFGRTLKTSRCRHVGGREHGVPEPSTRSPISPFKGWLSPAPMRAHARGLIEAYRVKTPSTEEPIETCRAATCSARSWRANCPRTSTCSSSPTPASGSIRIRCRNPSPDHGPAQTAARPCWLSPRTSTRSSNSPTRSR